MMLRLSTFIALLAVTLAQSGYEYNKPNQPFGQGTTPNRPGFPGAGGTSGGSGYPSSPTAPSSPSGPQQDGYPSTAGFTRLLLDLLATLLVLVKAFQAQANDRDNLGSPDRKEVPDFNPLSHLGHRTFRDSPARDPLDPVSALILAPTRVETTLLSPVNQTGTTPSLPRSLRRPSDAMLKLIRGTTPMSRPAVKCSTCAPTTELMISSAPTEPSSPSKSSSASGGISSTATPLLVYTS
ncbi:uncharacterized protein LOC125231948 [Leguminivora glycinivorella]|uniref:uncharacterized protein LOC125231948 n=1 Tax=Leguminivora glycinivorella TaxID=1035111 RepID=UPI00200DD09D|nr:uncharacterized protein LOC125231948 [Leguminivora glycinivorella]